MSVITFPSTLSAARMSWGQIRRDVAFNSPFGSQAVNVTGPQWTASLAPPLMKDSSAGQWQALMLQLLGKINQLEIWNLARPAPLGTMRGTLTVKGAHAQGATSLIMSGGAGQASTTIKQGDYFGLGSSTTQQVVMALADATADGAGDITINITGTPLRNAFSNGAAVSWDKPKALFRVVNAKTSWDYAPGLVVSGFALDLIEDWRT